MLHTINKSPFESNTLQDCIRFISENDVVLLFEDAVYAAHPGTNKSALAEEILKNNKVYALQADLKARGIDTLIKGIETADYDKFVDLVEEHTVQSWL
jgi:tRNA 2-thiouridine synthesizing protein B